MREGEVIEYIVAVRDQMKDQYSNQEVFGTYNFIAHWAYDWLYTSLLYKCSHLFSTKCASFTMNRRRCTTYYLARYIVDFQSVHANSSILYHSIQ